MSTNQKEFIWATKKLGSKTVTKRFTTIAWKLLGPNKNGWMQVPAEIANKTKDVIVPEATNKAEVSTNPVKEETIEELEARLNIMKANKMVVVDDSPDEPGTGNPQAPTYEGPKSTDEGVNVIAAIAHIKTLKSVSDIEGYTNGDDRSTIVKARDKFISELKDN